jgi:hypothetical protein
MNYRCQNAVSLNFIVSYRMVLLPIHQALFLCPCCNRRRLSYALDLIVRVTTYSRVPNRTRRARSPVRRPGRCCEQKKGT